MRGAVIAHSQRRLCLPGEISEEAFRGIKEFVCEESGIDLGSYKDGCIKRRISVRVRVSGSRTADEYLLKLKRDDKELKKLLKVLTINVTEFFRNPPTFNKVRDVVIPTILAEKIKKDDHVFKAWSVGCSSGEEPYSIAILLKDLLVNEYRKFSSSIVATDVDEEMLNKGCAALYDEGQLKNVEPHLKEKFFAREDDDKYRVVKSVRRVVTFKKKNLLEDSGYENQDIIFCRNILIYFSRNLQEEILLNLARALKKGGFLVLGKAETLTAGSRKLFEAICPTERIYQKIS
jgi:chemotaxis protein methyltransferase CheR